jgi:SpoVK/Ycf46/Vps4 family AAA+-type ATPase
MKVRMELSKSEKVPNDLFTLIEAPNEHLEVKWNTLYGIDDIKQSLKNYILNCLDRGRIDGWCGRNYPGSKNLREFLTRELRFGGKILLVGDPGTGKTQCVEGVAFAVSKELGRIYLMKPNILRSKFVGESSKRIIEVFKYAKEKAKEAPVLLFFDEFDSLAPNRNDEQMHEEIKASVNTLLEEMEKVSPSDRIIVVAATNLFEDAVDYAADRRFDLVIRFRRPSYFQRLNLFSILLKPFGIDFQTIKFLAKRTRGYTQADIKKIVKNALNIALTHNRKLTRKELFSSLRNVKPTRSYGFKFKERYLK